LIVRKISKIGATNCKIIKLKCVKCDFRWGFTRERAAGGSLQCSPDSRKEKGGQGKEMKGEGYREGRKGEAREEEDWRRWFISRILLWYPWQP